MTEEKGLTSARLADLRRSIDNIDARIHDLLMERAEIVEALGELKRAENGAGAYFRPGREAQILRRVAERHRGTLPVEAVLALWRTMVTAYLRLQWPFTVVTTDDAGVRDLARRHFGAATPIRTAPDAAAAINALATDAKAVAVAPDVNGNAWWLDPAFTISRGPRIVARLPLFGDVTTSAFVIASDSPDASGDDLAVVAIKNIAPGAEWAATARGLGLELLPLATYKASDGKASVLAAAANVTANDRRLDALAHALDVAVHVVGGYARPLDLSRS